MVFTFSPFSTIFTVFRFQRGRYVHVRTRALRLVPVDVRSIVPQAATLHDWGKRKKNLPHFTYLGVQSPVEYPPAWKRSMSLGISTAGSSVMSMLEQVEPGAAATAVAELSWGCKNLPVTLSRQSDAG